MDLSPLINEMQGAGDFGAEDLEKLAGIAYLEKIAESVGEELSDDEMAELAEMDDEDLGALIEHLSGEGGEGEEGGEAQAEPGEGEEVSAADLMGLDDNDLAELGFDKQSSAQILEADYIGREMARGYFAENMEKEAGVKDVAKKAWEGLKSAAKFSKSRANAASVSSGRSAPKGWTRKHKAIEFAKGLKGPAALYGGTAAGAGGLAALLKKKKKKAASAYDPLVNHQANAILEKVAEMAGAEDEPQAETFEDQINIDALNALSDAGYDVEELLGVLNSESE
jgi:hypothetical protein